MEDERFYKRMFRLAVMLCALLAGVIGMLLLDRPGNGVMGRRTYDTMIASGYPVCMERGTGHTWILAGRGWTYVGRPTVPIDPYEGIAIPLANKAKKGKPWEEDLSAYSDEDLEKIVADTVIAASNSTPPKAENP